MRDRARNFWLFQTIFWLVAGLALFLSGVSQGPVVVSLVRNVYFTLVGFLSGFFLAATYDRFAGASQVRLLVVGAVVCYLLGSLLTAVINPITFTMLGRGLGELSLGEWFSGSMNLALVLGLWSILYFVLSGRTAATTARPAAAPNEIAVETSQGKRLIPLDSILFCRAAGDYLEVMTTDGAHLKRGTLTSLAAALESEGFIRIHRSLLVNESRVQGIESRSKGEYLVILDNGERLKSGRRYREKLAGRFEAAR